MPVYVCRFCRKTDALRAARRAEPAGINPRHLSADTLALALRTCEPGSARHRALLDEQRRRRELAARVHQRQQEVA